MKGQTKQKKILFIVHHPIEDASSRYRVYQYLPYLEQQGYSCTVRPFSTRWLFRALRNNGSPIIKAAGLLFCTGRRVLDLCRLRRYDLVVILREAYPFLTPLFERVVLSRSKRTVFSFDDAIYVGHDRKKHKYSVLYRFKYGPGVREVIQRADLVVAGSRVLAEYARTVNRRVEVVPTVVDTEAYGYREAPEETDRPLTIGWYGSNSTSPYLAEVVPALTRLAAEYGGKVRFRFFGDTRLQLDLPNCEVHPFNLESELADLRSIDIGIMPLTDTPWTRAKCAFKAIQYMALGIPTVVSPHGMAGEVIENERNGLHAMNSEEWYEALNRLVLDAGLRKRLGEAGRQTIVENFSLERWGPEFTAMLESVMSNERDLPESEASGSLSVG